MPVCAVMSANTGSTGLLSAVDREACASRERTVAAADKAIKRRRLNFI